MSHATNVLVIKHISVDIVRKTNSLSINIVIIKYSYQRRLKTGSEQTGSERRVLAGMLRD